MRNYSCLQNFRDLSTLFTLRKEGLIKMGNFFKVFCTAIISHPKQLFLVRFWRFMNKKDYVICL